MDDIGAPNTKPWLIAAWPGMGSVALLAAGYLVQELDMEEVSELPTRDHFDINEVEVKGGLIEPVSLPRGTFYRWENPNGRNLVVFLSEAQPTSGTWRYSHELLEAASALGAELVVTFASMAAGLHPAEDPSVWGIATGEATLKDLKRSEVKPLEEGQIGGLNGVLLGAARERNIPGLCLMAEIPFFAAAVPNPKAARAALSVFSVLAGIDVSLDKLNRHAAAVDRALIAALEKMQAQQEGEPGAFEFEAEEPTIGETGGVGPATDRPEPPKEDEPKLSYTDRRRIERLFEEAKGDSHKAVGLKQELDRLGVFRQYEDRFLDLFRRGG